MDLIDFTQHGYKHLLFFIIGSEYTHTLLFIIAGLHRDTTTYHSNDAEIIEMFREIVSCTQDVFVALCSSLCVFLKQFH